MANPGSSLHFNTYWSAPPVSTLARSGGVYFRETKHSVVIWRASLLDKIGHQFLCKIGYQFRSTLFVTVKFHQSFGTIWISARSRSRGFVIDKFGQSWSRHELEQKCIRTRGYDSITNIKTSFCVQRQKLERVSFRQKSYLVYSFTMNKFKFVTVAIKRCDLKRRLNPWKKDFRRAP